MFSKDLTPSGVEGYKLWLGLGTKTKSYRSLTAKSAEGWLYVLCALCGLPRLICPLRLGGLPRLIPQISLDHRQRDDER